MTDSDNPQWDPRRYADNARFVSDLGMPLVELLAPAPGERVLDLGCGDGALTEALRAAGCEVVGVDASPEMVAAARERGLDARVMDGEALTFDSEFDAVLSNAALHWMLRPEAVLRGVAGALVPGGRFVAEMGGHGNVASITGAIEDTLRARGIAPPATWFFPRPETYRGLLASAGFTVEHMASFPRPTPLPGHIDGWLRTFGHRCFADVPESDREAVIAEVTAALAPRLCDADDRWTLDYVRLRFAARRAAPT